MKYLSSVVLAILLLVLSGAAQAEFKFVDDLALPGGPTYVDIAAAGGDWYLTKFNGQVEQYDSSFNLIQVIDFPSPTFGNGRSVDVDSSNGNLLYLSATTRVLTEFTPSLELVVDYPTSFDGTSVAALKLDPVTNTNWSVGVFTGLVRNFSRDGQVLGEFQTEIFDAFNGMAIDTFNRTILLSDPAPDKIYEYTLDGEFVGLAFDGNLGEGFSNGIHYDSETARLYSINADGVMSIWEDESRLLTGDFDSDGMFDCTDVDSLVAEIASGSNSDDFDLNGDGTVDQGDLSEWLAEAGEVNNPSGNPYLPGDANLDGFVDVSDFGIWNENKFTEHPAWCSGDFNADGVVDVSDFGIWNQSKFLSSDSLSDVAMVPEPPMGQWSWLALATLLMINCRKRFFKRIRD